MKNYKNSKIGRETAQKYGDIIETVSYTHLDVYKRQSLLDGMNYFRLVSRLSSITARTMTPMTRRMPTMPMSIMGRVVIHEEMCIRDRVLPQYPQN